MKQLLLSQTQGHSRLILVWLGWGMDPEPFPGLQRAGYDVMLLWGYDGVPLDEQPLRRYGEIVVVAWSLGVRAAAEWLANTRLPVTRRVAVNGTPQHISASCGITPAIFQGTLNGLSELSVRKFRRRMFATAEDFAAFHAPQRTLADLRSELEYFASLPPLPQDDNRRWDVAIIGLQDHIFPPLAQRQAWQQVQTLELPQMAHFPDLRQIITEQTVDKALVQERFTCAAPSYGPYAQVQQQVARRLWQLAEPYIGELPPEACVLEVGAAQTLLTRLYDERIPNVRREYWDLVPRCSTKPLSSQESYLQCDAESEIWQRPGSSVDILLSASTLQWFNSVPTFLRQARRVLKPGGICAVAFYVKGTMAEIVAVAPRLSLQYVEAERLVNNLPRQWRVLATALEPLYLEFEQPQQVLRHLRQTGVNALQRQASALTLVRHYPLTSNGKARLTYVPLYLILQKNG